MTGNNNLGFIIESLVDYDIIKLKGDSMLKKDITKESPAQRKKRVAEGFKARPAVMIDKKTKLKSRKQKHKKRLF